MAGPWVKTFAESGSSVAEILFQSALWSCFEVAAQARLASGWMDGAGDGGLRIRQCVDVVIGAQVEGDGCVAELWYP